MKKLINIKTLLAALTVLAVSSCADEELIQNMGQAGQLHIGSVSVGDNKVASRTDGEEGTSTPEVSPKYNEVVTSVDKLFLNYSFVENSTSLNKQATAEKNTAGTWTITGAALKPNGNNEKWANLKMTATNIQDGGYVEVMPKDKGITSWSNASNTRIYQDKVSASSVNNGGITIDNNLTSATLGKLSIALKHEHALLRLGNLGNTSTYNVKGGTYVKDGVAYNVNELNPLKMLWAVMKIDNKSIYIPLTSEVVEFKPCLQAIVPVGSLTGFRAVMNVGNNQEFYLDFGITEENLVANTQYNLTLTITKNLQKVGVLRSDKPGWGTDDEDTLKDWKQTAGLEYVQGQGFKVTDANGLLLLNQWMTGIGDEIKYITGYSYIDKNASRMSHNIKIASNITFNDDHKIFDLDGTGSDMSNWKPLGGSGNEYTGTFDGNGKTITGLAIFTNNRTAGLADRLGEGGIIKNLTVSGATVKTTENHTGIISSYTAGIIENCKVISSTVTGGGDYVGAIAGTNNGTIIACEVSGITTVTGTSHVAGIAGSNSGSIVACSTKHDWSSNVTNNLTLNATATDTSNHYSAGLVSENTGAVYGSWTTKVNDANHVDDGIYGGSGVIKNCFSASTIANEKIGDQQNPAETTMNYAIALYNASLELTNPAYCNWHWNDTNDTPALVNEAPIKTFKAAYVPESKSFKVATYDGLKQICEWMWKGKEKGHNYEVYKGLFNPDDWNNDQSTTPNDYVDYPMTNVPGFESNMNDPASLSERCKYNITLTSDINLTGQELYDLDGDGYKESNWLYLFGDGTSYEGTFDGGGKKIIGLKIMSKRSQTGLVDVLGTNGVIKNLTLENPVISGSVDGTGFFVSANNGIVENCHITGETSQMTVTCSPSTHAFDNGAIVGQNAGVVMACTVSGKLSMKGCYSFGGIVGANRNGYVVACRNTSNLSVSHACSHDTQYTETNYRVGSLVGINRQTTTDNGETTINFEGYVYGSYSSETSNVLVGNSSGGEYTGSNKIGVFESPIVNVTDMNDAIATYNASPKFGKYCEWLWSNNGVIKLEKN